MTLSNAGRQPSLHDAMVTYLREHGGGTPPEELAAFFLKLKDPKGVVAAAAIRGILAADRRCFVDDTGQWHARAPSGSAADATLGAQPWCAFFCKTDQARRRLLYCSLFDLSPEPTYVLGGWCIDPSSLPIEDRNLLTDSLGPAAETGNAVSLLENIVRFCGNRIAVFLSSLDRSAITLAAAEAGYYLPDNSMLVSELALAAGIALSRPLTLASLEQAVLGNESGIPDPVKQGERFAACVDELMRQLSPRGIETLDDLDRALQRDRSHLFSGKAFTGEDLLALPSCPGVYGFKDKTGAWLYIGKSSNLRRRLLGYFGDSDESPQKLKRLLDESYSLVIQPYGSELECLIYEYRLIKKYAPLLNSKTDIFERSGSYKPIHDCIVLLPHRDTDKAVSLWLREGHKILLRTVTGDFNDTKPLKGELESFFFTKKMPAAPSDFPELEIAARWIKQAGDGLPVVPVSGMANAGEVGDAVRYAWREFHERRISAAAQKGNKESGFRRV
jgi:hypothetical protein